LKRGSVIRFMRNYHFAMRARRLVPPNKERNMTDQESFDTYADDPYEPGPIPRAKPEERPTGGMSFEEMLGCCADVIDDEFLEAVLAIRRGVWPKECRS
jgi:hypothetical protein